MSNIATGANARVDITINSWSSAEEREQLITTMLEKGSGALLKALQKTSVKGRFAFYMAAAQLDKGQIVGQLPSSGGTPGAVRPGAGQGQSADRLRQPGGRRAARRRHARPAGRPVAVAGRRAGPGLAFEPVTGPGRDAFPRAPTTARPERPAALAGRPTAATGPAGRRRSPASAPSCSSVVVGCGDRAARRAGRGSRRPSSTGRSRGSRCPPILDGPLAEHPGARRDRGARRGRRAAAGVAADAARAGLVPGPRAGRGLHRLLPRDAADHPAVPGRLRAARAAAAAACRRRRWCWARSRWC